MSPSLGTGRATGCDCCGIGLRIRDGTPNICSQQVQGHAWLLTQLARRDGCAKNHRVALHLGVLAGGLGAAGISPWDEKDSNHFRIYLKWNLGYGF